MPYRKFTLIIIGTRLIHSEPDTDHLRLTPGQCVDLIFPREGERLAHHSFVKDDRKNVEGPYFWSNT
jgi:hypothetical protein